MLTIELSTFAFYRGEIPREIALRDCGLPLERRPRRALSAFYGLQGKQDGFVEARDYAATNNLKYTVIDFLVELEAQNPGLMKPEELSKYDFLNFSRASRKMLDQASYWLSDALVSRTGADDLVAALTRLPFRTFLAERPELVDELMEIPSCNHLKVIAFQAVTSLRERPISIGNVPYRHWGAIVEATCRLNPTVRITLESPR